MGADSEKEFSYTRVRPDNNDLAGLYGKVAAFCRCDMFDAKRS